ncbi:MAG: nucleotidyltransferase domain-containing protein [Magnetococcales bacterium]|nr:nucleotidyltransferase domain-containing protein [Magnetococcales bacterium]
MSSPDSQLLQDVVDRILATTQPERIILFGSAARDQMGPDSDLDLLVVMPDGTHRRQMSRSIYQALRGLGIAKDVVVVTRQDVIDFGQNPAMIIAPALSEGRKLYHEPFMAHWSDEGSKSHP